MKRERRSRQWWRATVERWRRSGMSARAFGEREGIRGGTILWWSSRLGRGANVEHDATELKPIEIAIPSSGPAVERGPIEIEVSGVVVRCAGGAEVSYVAALVRALGTR